MGTTFFLFPDSKRYLEKHHDALESVVQVKHCEGDIEVFTPAELTEILSFANDLMVPLSWASKAPRR